MPRRSPRSRRHSRPRSRRHSRSRSRRHSRPRSRTRDSRRYRASFVASASAAVTVALEEATESYKQQRETPDYFGDLVNRVELVENDAQMKAFLNNYINVLAKLPSANTLIELLKRFCGDDEDIVEYVERLKEIPKSG